jgi:4'-phosphopantetheinyl transferase
MDSFWKIASADLSLSKKDIHLWRADLNLPDRRIQELSRIISTAERMRAERFHFERDSRKYAIGFGILRTILGHYVGIEPKELRFIHGRGGKPMLDGVFANRYIHFNMSHSEGLALYGFTRDHEIGVDIEFVRDIPEMDDIAEQFFSKKENKVFRSLPERKKKEAFFSCWTRKEAFIKAIGDGLYHPLDNFDVGLKPGESAKLIRMGGDSKSASRWLIQDLKPGPGFIAAFAVEGHDWRLHFWQWSD